MKHVKFLKNLEELQLTGQVIQTDSQGQSWTFFLAQGRIVYAIGGEHAIRRWRRNLIRYCPRIPTYRLAWQIDLTKAEPADLQFGWEYALLKFWVAQQKITKTQAENLIQSTIAEVTFDVIQAVDVTEKIQYANPPSLIFKPIEVEQTIARAQALQQRWEQAQLRISPNHAPIVRQPEQLQHMVPAQLYSTLIKLLDGQRSLRDLAVEMKRDLVDVALSLRRFVYLDLIQFVPIADLPSLVFKPPIPASPTAETALIACVDDSFTVRHTMENLLVSAGYRFLSIEDPMRAIGVLLTHKPDFVFLDLIMPNVNGYEICEKLRQISCFHSTPIVILTGSDGYANRLRSNFVGASDFVSKPLNAAAVLGVIHKHLQVARDRSVVAK